MKRFIAVTISLYLAACISLCCIFAAGPQAIALIGYKPSADLY